MESNITLKHRFEFRFSQQILSSLCRVFRVEMESLNVNKNWKRWKT